MTNSRKANIQLHQINQVQPILIKVNYLKHKINYLLKYILPAKNHVPDKIYDDLDQQIIQIRFQISHLTNVAIRKLDFLAGNFAGNEESMIPYHTLNLKATNIWTISYVAKHATRYNLKVLLSEQHGDYFAYKNDLVSVHVKGGTSAFKKCKQYVPVNVSDIVKLMKYIKHNIKNGHFKAISTRHQNKTEAILDKGDVEGDKMQKLIDEGKI